jgi:hypothetical protein
VREKKRNRRGEQYREGEREEGGKGKMEGETVLGEVPSSSRDHFRIRFFSSSPNQYLKLFNLKILLPSLF